MSNEKVKKLGRRGLLKAAAGLSAASVLVGVPAFVFRANEGTGMSASTSAEADFEPGAPIVAYVQDPDKGTLVVMSGTEEAVITDRHLVARLMSAARG